MSATPNFGMRYTADAPSPNEGEYIPRRASVTGRLLVESLPAEAYTTAFGENVSAHFSPAVQIDAQQGLTDDVETFSATGGAVSGASKMFKCESGTSVGGYGTIRSRRQVTYAPGQETRGLLTARFSAGATLGYQFAGLFHAEDAVGFGRVGTDFGIIRQTDGRAEIRTLTISQAAGGAETVTVTLNTVAYTASVTSGTTAQNAAEIAADSEFGASAVWKAYAVGATVVFVANATGAKAGTYSVSSTGTLAGSYATNQTGTANVRTFIAEADWNGEALGFTLNPTKLNLYRIHVPYLGAGDITFWIRHPTQGAWRLCHRLEYPNSAETPNVHDPYFNIGWVAASLGSTTELVTEGASAAAGSIGDLAPRRNTRGASADLAAITTTFLPVLSLRVRATMANDINKREIRLDSLSAAFEHTKTGRIELREDATLTGAQWTYVDEPHSCVEIDTSATAVSGGQVISAGGLPKSGRTEVFVSPANRYEREKIITVCVRALSGTGGEASVGIAWQEV